MKEIADALISSGLADAGFRTVDVVCSGWLERNSTGFLTENMTRWPSGMKGLADYLHERGLLLGVYTSPGETNCCGEPASYGHEQQDADFFASIGADHVMSDWCGGPPEPACHRAGGCPVATFRETYAKMGKAIAAASRPMIFGACSGGAGRPWKWARDIGAQYWRLTADIRNTWASVLHNFDTSVSIPGVADLAGPGHYNYLDQTVVGVVPAPGAISGDGLSLEEARAHLSLWIIQASVLKIDNDVRSIPPAILKLLTNKDVWAVHRDALGLAGKRIDVGEDRGVTTDWQGQSNGGPFSACRTWNSHSQWGKPLADGDWAVVLFNRKNATESMTLSFDDVGNGETECWSIHDLWGSSSLGRRCFSIALTVPGPGVRFLRITPAGSAPPPPPCNLKLSHGLDAHFQRHDGGDGWFANHNTTRLVGKNGAATTLGDCASACLRTAGCRAFHVWAACDASPSNNMSDPKGACYNHLEPTGSFVAHTDSPLFIRHGVALESS
eukprot:COSAG01_NODE_4754_length_4764_cov_12.145123_2_plen_499_part_00